MRKQFARNKDAVEALWTGSSFSRLTTLQHIQQKIQESFKAHRHTQDADLPLTPPSKKEPEDAGETRPTDSRLLTSFESVIKYEVDAWGV